MNNIKYLLFLILCLGITGKITNVCAQYNDGGNKILATAGGKTLKQSDVDKVIEFFEWAFETKFTDEQRNEYQTIKAAQFQSDSAETRKGIDDMLNTFAAVRAKSEDQQENLRRAFVPDFVGTLRKGSDAEAKLLTTVYEGAKAAGNGEVETGGDVSSLVGKWVWSRTGSSTISTVGTYMGSNGSRFTYQFSPNGAVEFTGFMNVMQGGCSQQIFRLIKGQASLSGSTLTIRWQPEKFTRDFSCDTANNYTKTMPAKTEKLQINFKNDLGQKQLCFEGAECFSPTR